MEMEAERKENDVLIFITLNFPKLSLDFKNIYNILLIYLFTTSMLISFNFHMIISKDKKKNLGKKNLTHFILSRES